MKNAPINKQVILLRVNGIQGEMQELKKVRDLNFDEFSSGSGYKIAHYHLHRALEGVFNIGSHILARIPGVEITDYKGIAISLGANGIVDKKFANTKLKDMAGYRNRLVHFYAEISSEEIYKIINEDLDDFDIFLESIKKFLQNPQKFNLTIDL
ncbi:MAG: HepT-like ribonuclease domain-containing protein [Patescibacteria group bacterium]|nr:HepT-like ribonuclease domain-containing protein [Patescibacteria group bacterium]